MLTDAELIDFVDMYMGQCILKVGHRWYWSRGYGKPHHRADSLRDAVAKAVEALKPVDPKAVL